MSEDLLITSHRHRLVLFSETCKRFGVWIKGSAGDIKPILPAESLIHTPYPLLVSEFSCNRRLGLVIYKSSNTHLDILMYEPFYRFFVIHYDEMNLEKWGIYDQKPANIVLKHDPAVLLSGPMHRGADAQLYHGGTYPLR